MRMRPTAGLVAAAAVIAAAVGTPVARAGFGGGGFCGLAYQKGLVPAGDTCYNGLRVDVTGDGRTDLVVLYDRGHPGVNGSPPRFGPYTLKVVSATGEVLEARFRAPLPPAVIVAARRVNDQPGVELFIRVARASSGSSVAIYSDLHGRLVRSRVTVTFGGDSASKFGFSCVRTPRPEIVQRSYELLGPNINGRWRERIDTYSWTGARLHRTGSTSMIHHGWPGAGAVAIGAGCGPLPGFS